MAISDKTRKQLWAKSGNRCAICNKELFLSSNNEEECNIGEECHIISSKSKGPRHKANISDYDTYDNLILLCRNHHKEIDTNYETYTEEILRYMKENHEQKVKSAMDGLTNPTEKSKPRFLSKITTGKELASIINGVHGYRTDYDDGIEQAEIEYIAGTLQAFTDWGYIYNDLEIYDKIKADFDLASLIKEIEERGYFLFGDRVTEKWKFLNGSTEKFPVATLVIKKNDSPDIIKMDLSNKEEEKMDNS